jgi:hypothetical protein
MDILYFVPAREDLGMVTQVCNFFIAHFFEKLWSKTIFRNSSLVAEQFAWEKLNFSSDFETRWCRTMAGGSDDSDGPR